MTTSYRPHLRSYTASASWKATRRDHLLAEGRRCFLCLRDHLHPHVHHIFGKANDLDDTWLVTLCPACHALVEAAAGRGRLHCGNASFWHRLAALAWAKAWAGRPRKRPGSAS